MKIRIKKVKENAKVPEFAHPGDAGMDIYSTEEFVLAPGDKKIVDLGFSMQFSPDHMVIFKDKSSLASKYGIHTLAGVIDSGYRGECKAALINLGDEDFEVTEGQKIGQMLVLPKPKVEIEEVEKLDSSDRGEGGFGSTGKF